MTPGKTFKYSEETANQIEMMSAMGLNMKMIEAVIDITIPTIYKYYSHCLIVGKTNANLQVAKRVFALATDEGVPPAVQLNACMFWLKTQAGWKEGMDLNITGQINHNTQIQINFIGTDGTKQEGHAISAKRAIPRKEIGYEESETWEPTFVGERDKERAS